MKDILLNADMSSPVLVECRQLVGGGRVVFVWMHMDSMGREYSMELGFGWK
jgi:hypothetical protein